MHSRLIRGKQKALWDRLLAQVPWRRQHLGCRCGFLLVYCQPCHRVLYLLPALLT